MKKILSAAAVAVAAVALQSCQPSANTAAPALGLNPDSFGIATVDGKNVQLYTLKNAQGAVAQFTNLGAKMVTLFMPDRNGQMDDIVMGYATAADYAYCDNAVPGKGEPFFGATIGRYGNRIAEGKFSIDGVEYQLDQNEGNVSIHGGKRGYYSVVWDAKQESDSKIVFTYLSPDGEMGFPGNLNVTLSYELTDANEVVITYGATTDKPTVVNLTNHSFFNLNGEDDETVNDEVIRIAADFYTPVDSLLLPTGELATVEGTPFDLRKGQLISDSLESQHPQMLLGHGYDHNFVLSDSLNADGLRFAAEVKDAQSGRVMKVYTNEPGIQFYEGNFLNGTQVGKSGKAYPYRGALCLETQHFPNSPNIESFPTTRLNPGEQYKSVCVYAFSVEK